MLKRLDVWQGGSTSIDGRTILINSSLSNVPTYHVYVPATKNNH
uniref:Uncharacterized protein n=1 Tax=Arundo donax TaxID=35708 RepID=A0A0A8YEY3_ARUDO